jgi:hypothetical protein
MPKKEISAFFELSDFLYQVNLTHESGPATIPAKPKTIKNSNSRFAACSPFLEIFIKMGNRFTAAETTHRYNHIDTHKNTFLKLSGKKFFQLRPKTTSF